MSSIPSRAKFYEPQFVLHEAAFFTATILQKFERIELAEDAMPPEARPPAAWKKGPGRKAIEKIKPKSDLTLSVEVSNPCCFACGNRLIFVFSTSIREVSGYGSRGLNMSRSLESKVSACTNSHDAHFVASELTNGSRLLPGCYSGWICKVMHVLVGYLTSSM